MTPPPRKAAAALAAIAALALAGCGGGGSTTRTSAAPQSFPPGPGHATLGKLIGGLPQSLNLAPSVSSLEGGRARFAFGLIDAAGRQVEGAPVAVYVASESQRDVRGPYPARAESLAVAPRFRSRTNANDPAAARGVYVATLPVTRGKRVVLALVRAGGKLVASTAVLATIDPPGGPPKVGDGAIRVHTPTAASVGGDLSRIDTRIPPDDMHAVDLANVLGRRPVFIVFATPALCKSRVCAPIVDEVEQLKSELGNRMAFIHMEVYRDNSFAKGYRPQMRAWRLQTEPWVFAIGRDGRIRGRLEGAASLDELRTLAQRALG